MCDRDLDCADGSDEQGCPNNKCKDNEFPCTGGRCITSKWVCGKSYQYQINILANIIQFAILNFQMVMKTVPMVRMNQIVEQIVQLQLHANQMNSDAKEVVNVYQMHGVVIATMIVMMTAMKRTVKRKNVNHGCLHVVMADVFIIHGNAVRIIDRLYIQISFSLPFPQFFNFISDGDNDCINGTDEQNCTDINAKGPASPPAIIPTCHDWMYKCGNSRCVPYWWKCDGINDCGDGSDELGCPNSTDTTTPSPGIIAPEITCSGERFSCNSGRCIERKYVCDGFPDCSNGEDEKNCRKNVCSRDEFRYSYLFHLKGK